MFQVINSKCRLEFAICTANYTQVKKNKINLKTKEIKQKSWNQVKCKKNYLDDALTIYNQKLYIILNQKAFQKLNKLLNLNKNAFRLSFLLMQQLY